METQNGKEKGRRTRSSTIALANLDGLEELGAVHELGSEVREALAGLVGRFLRAGLVVERLCDRTRGVNHQNEVSRWRERKQTGLLAIHQLEEEALELGDS